MNVLIIDDDQTLRELFKRELEHSGHQVVLAASAAEGFSRLAEAEPDVVLLDLMLPDVPGIDVLRRLRAERPGLEVVVLTAHGTVDTAITAMKLGAFDYLQKPCHLQELELTLHRAHERKRLGEDNARLRDGLSSGTSEAEIVGCGPAFVEQQRFIAKVAQSDSTVLLRGETGAGKELVARALHRLSPRCDQPFVVLDCAAFNENLLQSELFGHEKGAFTGAGRLKYGLFEVAHGGTAFLDEIGDVSPSVQASLLRVLETSSFRRLGGTREVQVQVRLIAATNRNLERMMRAGQFRQDLYFRLNTIHIDLPPLRRRREEIAFLVQHFVSRHNESYRTRKTVSPEAMAVLTAHDWPGNVRELRHVIERALVLADDDAIKTADLPIEVQREPALPLAAAAGEAGTLAEIEARHIARVLSEVGGHRARAAQVLGISERSLYRKIHEYHLDSDTGP
ncbi:MAG: sigma-54-dependent transcriptional regulator [Myxococcaceae bacterium]